VEKPTQNADAYDAYLRAVAIDDAASLDTTKQVAPLYAEAVRLDPQFALAWARLAVARSQLYFNGVDPEETNSGAVVKEAADRALSLQPELGEAWLAQGVYRYRVLRDFKGALRSYEEALRRLPNSAFVLEQMAHLERRLGQFDAAQKHYEAAAQLDPRNIGILLTLADTFGTLRRFDEARAVLDHILEISPGNGAALGSKAESFQAQGRLNEAAEVLAKAGHSQDEHLMGTRVLQLYEERRFDAAIAQIQQNMPAALANDPRIQTLLGYCQKFVGKDDEARATFTRAAAVMKPTPDSVVAVDARNLPCYLAWVYAGLGDKEKALEQARRAVADYDSDAIVKPFAETSLAIVEAQLGDIDSAIAALPHLLEVLNGETCGDLQVNPLWDPLRKDPRFEKLCQNPKE
jgi:tetratricopeptide (TPR) repeat protein